MAATRPLAVAASVGFAPKTPVDHCHCCESDGTYDAAALASRQRQFLHPCGGSGGGENGTKTAGIEGPGPRIYGSFACVADSSWLIRAKRYGSHLVPNNFCKGQESLAHPTCFLFGRPICNPGPTWLQFAVSAQVNVVLCAGRWAARLTATPDGGG